MSQYLQQLVGHLLQHIGPEMVRRYDFINNPIPNLPENYKKQYLFYDDKINIGRTGRPENGIYDSISIDAIDYLFSMRPELRNKIRFIALAPPSNMVKDLKKYNIDHFIVEPTINNEDIFRFYNSMNICAHARLDGETCGCVIEEAMMYGIPVVTHVSEPNNPDIYSFQAQCFLVEDRVTGFVVDHNVKSYAMALLALIDNFALRSQMGAAGKEKALREFETSVCVDKLEWIYKEILNV